MIKKIAVVAAAAGGLVLASASLAVAGSGAYGGDKQNSSVVCAVGKGVGVSNSCGNTYIYNPQILDNVLNLLSAPTTDGGGNNGGGGGGNN